MPIAFDTATNGGSSVFVASDTWSHTCTGSDRALVVGVTQAFSPIAVSTVTYAGVAMTLVRTDTQGANMRTDLYVLANPASGANNVIVTMAASAYFIGTAVSLTGVHQTTPTDTHNGANGSSSGTTSISLTTVTDQAWIVDCIATDDNSITANAGQTQRMNLASTGGVGGASSKGPVTPAGATTVGWAVTSGNVYASSAVALRPAASGGGGSTTSFSTALLMGV